MWPGEDGAAEQQPRPSGGKRSCSQDYFSTLLTFSASIAIAALPTLGHIIPPATENVIPPPLVTALAVTNGNVPFYRSRITLLSDIARTPKDGVPTISVWIVRRNPLAPDIRRLHFRSINIAPQHCRSARVHIATPLGTSLRPLNLAHNPLLDP